MAKKCYYQFFVRTWRGPFVIVIASAKKEACGWSEFQHFNVSPLSRKKTKIDARKYLKLVFSMLLFLVIQCLPSKFLKWKFKNLRWQWRQKRCRHFWRFFSVIFLFQFCIILSCKLQRIVFSKYRELTSHTDSPGF